MVNPHYQSEHQNTFGTIAYNQNNEDVKSVGDTDTMVCRGYPDPERGDRWVNAVGNVGRERFGWLLAMSLNYITSDNFGNEEIPLHETVLPHTELQPAVW